MILETLFGITQESNSFDALATVDKDEQIPTPDYRYRRHDMRRYRVAVKFLVYDDPHLDPVPLHHRQQQGSKPLPQPLLASVRLLALRKQLWHRGDGFAGSVLRKGHRDAGDQETKFQNSFHMIIAINPVSSQRPLRVLRETKSCLTQSSQRTQRWLLLFAEGRPKC